MALDSMRAIARELSRAIQKHGRCALLGHARVRMTFQRLKGDGEPDPAFPPRFEMRCRRCLA